MLTHRKTAFLAKLKSFDSWLAAIAWIMSLYVMGLGAVILLHGAWQGLVYFGLGAIVHPKLAVPVWVRILAYILIILIL